MFVIDPEPRCALLKLESLDYKYFSRPVLPRAWITLVSVKKDYSRGNCKLGVGYGFSRNECVNKTLKSDNHAYLSEQVPGACYVSSMGVKGRDRPPCVADVNYGFTGPYVWVRAGCQAEFTVCYME
ncbi:lectin ADEL-like [Aplysia californica]|uniref:Lectin ADEL-like n=1 Tax=Aplysia californica TaxID=6500 RepID=A0ABM1VYU5_APLCA|nr:lectin ADEL-like [Aplysia californica]